MQGKYNLDIDGASLDGRATGDIIVHISAGAHTRFTVSGVDFVSTIPTA
jgi:DnaJ-class molecular chaperone